MKKLIRKAKKALNVIDKWGKRNALALLSLSLQVVILVRVEGLHDKLDQLAAGIAGSLVTLYMSGVAIANELGYMITKILGIVSGSPS